MRWLLRVRVKRLLRQPVVLVAAFHVPPTGDLGYEEAESRRLAQGELWAPTWVIVEHVPAPGGHVVVGVAYWRVHLFLGRRRVSVMAYTERFP
jgi:hypothetical protein